MGTVPGHGHQIGATYKCHSLNHDTQGWQNALQKSALVSGDTAKLAIILLLCL